MGVAKAALECTVHYLASDLGKRKIRVRCDLGGPIKTLAARGISGLGDMLRSHAERAPLQRNVDVKEVGSTGVFLASDESSRNHWRGDLRWTVAITSWDSKTVQIDKQTRDATLGSSPFAGALLFSVVREWNAPLRCPRVGLNNRSVTSDERTSAKDQGRTPAWR